LALPHRPYELWRIHLTEVLQIGPEPGGHHHLDDPAMAIHDMIVFGGPHANLDAWA